MSRYNVNGYCGIASYYNTGLTYSVYACYCATPSEALEKLIAYFKKECLGNPIKQIDVLPKGVGPHDNATPVLVKQFPESK